MALTETQEKILNKFEKSDGFLPYIEEIRFPMYKSLTDNLRLDLSWPIVALVGPNGTNKSSILQALSAAPEGRSLAQFWFSTEVDDIDRGIRGKATHRFIYQYKFDMAGKSAECRKYRGSKRYRASDVPRALQGKRDPDYWEPTKRVASDAMAELPAVGYDDLLSASRDRWNQIRKSVLYLDFRSELSAFDKYIHHQSFDRWTPDATQKRYKVVQRSKWVARALLDKSLPKNQVSRLKQKVRMLEPAAVGIVAKILGKPIEDIAIIEHSFFGPTGYTIRLHLAYSGTTYSEAHAGSGEYAVVRLVDAIKRARQRSLILLDEPEVSLHPGAQNELMKFIEQEVLAHGHQVVLSTHSPSLAAALPSRAIKVLGFDTSNQRVALIADGCSSTEAFTHLGHTTSGPTRPRLIVEDELAAEVVRASLRRLAPAKLDSLEIVPVPGGADGIVTNALPTVVLAGIQKTGILLDGDQVPEVGEAKKATSADFESWLGLAVFEKNVKELIKIWKSNFHKSVPYLYLNSDKSARQAYEAENLGRCIEWSAKHLGFLPGSTPEELLATALLPDLEGERSDWKEYWVGVARQELRLTDDETLTAEQILNTQRNAISSLDDGCPMFKHILEVVDRIIDW